jgi:hypothetical protein
MRIAPLAFLLDPADPEQRLGPVQEILPAAQAFTRKVTVVSGDGRLRSQS